jgi:hypothetical protein
MTGRVCAAALLSAVVLSASVFGLDAVRVRLPPEAGSSHTRVTRDLPVERLPNRWLVVICVVRNTGTEPVTVTAAVRAGTASTVTVQPGDSSRIELTWDRTASGSTPILQLSADRAGWTLEAAELANLYGFSRGVVTLVIVPHGQDSSPAPRWLWGFLIVMGAIAVRVQPVARPRGMTATMTVLQVGVILLFLAAAIAPHVTSYRVGLAPRTFALGVFVLASPSLWSLFLRLHRRVVGEGKHRGASLATVGVLACLFFFSAMWQVRATYDGNYSGFVHLTRAVAARAPFLSSSPELLPSLILYDYGYDAQFMYLMAFDPFLRQFDHAPERYREFLDLPAYRYGRIGFSVLTKLFSVDQPRLYPTVMMWLIVLAHFGIGAIAADMASAHGRPPWTGLAYLAIPGFLSSLVFALPESLAALAIVAGIWNAQRSRLLTAAGLFAVATLFRETTVVVALAVIVGHAYAGRSVARGVAAALLAVVPLVAWRAYVAQQLFADAGWAAAFPNPAILGVPGAGLSMLFLAGASATQAPTEVAGALTFPFLIVIGAVVAATAWWRTRSSIAFAAAVYGLLALLLNYQAGFSHLPSGERTTYELFLCLFLLLLIAPARHAMLHRALAGFFVAAALYTFGFSPEADVARAAVFVNSLAP